MSENDETMNSTFTTHASVRIKGTENNYNPVQCFDQLCPNKSPHMHCPFCVKNDCYSDPVILKAHYRVKHVDKGIEFAGLKILRCCDHCDIVGIIKGEKKFKGAHWHCYKCKNGFNRRDEAVKHYKTHFRNPQTTFQIQITQEVNQPLSTIEHMTAATTITGEEMSIHPVLTEAITCMATSEDHGFHQTGQSCLLNGKLDNIHVPVPSNEIDVSETQTIMIIQEDGNLEGSFTTQTESNEAEDTDENGVIDVPSPGGSEGHFEELAQRCQQLEKEKNELEINLQSQIQQLQAQVDHQAEEIASYQKREQELVTQLSIPLDKGIQELLKHLQSQHKDLLHQQLAYLKRTYLSGGDVNSETVDAETDTTNNHQIIVIGTGGQETEMAILETISVEQNEMTDENSVHSIEVCEIANLAVEGNLGTENRKTGHDGSGDHLDSKSDFVEMVKAEMVKHNLAQPVTAAVELSNNADSDSDMVPIENDGCPPSKRRKE